MENDLTIGVVDMETKAEQEMAPIMLKAQAFQVVDETTYLDADEIAKEIKRRVEDRKVELNPPKEAATKAWKAMCALVKKYIDDPLAAVQTLDRKRYAWKKAEEKKRADEAEVLRREEAKKQAEEKLALAARMEEVGMKEQAEKVLYAPIAPTTVTTPVAIEKPKGQTQIENWTARIVNPDLVPREFCVPSQVKLNELARLMKGKAVCAGVEFEDVGKTSRRST
jgi:hypothetical protein